MKELFSNESTTTYNVGKGVQVAVPSLFKVLPFYEITAGRFDAHSRIKKDCSHFCNNPMMFLPVWDSLTRLINSTTVPL